MGATATQQNWTESWAQIGDRYIRLLHWTGEESGVDDGVDYPWDLGERPCWMSQSFPCEEPLIGESDVRTLRGLFAMVGLVVDSFPTRAIDDAVQTIISLAEMAPPGDQEETPGKHSDHPLTCGNENGLCCSQSASDRAIEMGLMGHDGSECMDLDSVFAPLRLILKGEFLTFPKLVPVHIDSVLLSYLKAIAPTKDPRPVDDEGEELITYDDFEEGDCRCIIEAHTPPTDAAN